MSRARLTAAEEIIRELRRDKADLRKQVDEVNDRLERMLRVKSGMPRNSDRPTRESIPDEVEDEIKAYETRVVRTQLRNEVRQARASGESWDEILLALQSPAPAVFIADVDEEDGDD